MLYPEHTYFIQFESRERANQTSLYTAVSESRLIGMIDKFNGPIGWGKGHILF